MRPWWFITSTLLCLFGLLVFLTFKDQCVTNFLAASGSPRLLRAVVRNKGDLGRACSRGGAFPVVDAVESGNEATLIYIISEGANVNVHNRDGSTPLIAAAEMGRTAMVKLLISAGADVNAVDLTGSSALRYAARTGNYDESKVLVNAGADPNQPTNEGDTPLMVAAEIGKGELVHLLVAHGADRNHRDKRGRRALDYLPPTASPSLIRELTPESLIDHSEQSHIQ